jgi:transposase
MLGKYSIGQRRIPGIDNGMVRPTPQCHTLMTLINGFYVSPNDEVVEQTMSKDSEKRDIKKIGIDLVKNSFQVYAADEFDQKVMNRKMNKQKLKVFMLKQPPCEVGMEACGSAHYWARLFISFGHKVKLIAPQFIKPFVKSNKNDAVDAEAVCEAMQRPNMRFVAIKTVEQLDIQAVHRMRELAVNQRTAQVNQIRGLLLENGIDVAKGRVNLTAGIPGILGDAENGLSDFFRGELAGLYQELKHLDGRIAHYDQTIGHIAAHDSRAKQLMTIPGIAAKGATALLAAIGDISHFKNGRELAAWLGLVPRQHSTGGKQTLLGISKRGDVYVRQLLVHGARAVMRCIDKKTDRNSQWGSRLKARRHTNVAVVAMANKMARICFALLRKAENYQADMQPVVVQRTWPEND